MTALSPDVIDIFNRFIFANSEIQILKKIIPSLINIYSTINVTYETFLFQQESQIFDEILTDKFWNFKENLPIK